MALEHLGLALHELSPHLGGGLLLDQVLELSVGLLDAERPLPLRALSLLFEEAHRLEQVLVVDLPRYRGAAVTLQPSRWLIACELRSDPRHPS